MAVRFDASGEHYTRTLTLGLQSAFSVSMWARLAVDRNTWGTFLALQSTNSIILEVGSDGTSLDIWDDDAGSVVAGPTSLTVGTWYYLAYSVQAGANASLLYVRAADGATVTDTWTQGSRTLTTLWLGNNQYSEWLNGNLAGVKVWTAGLSQAELELESRQYTPVRTANLQAFYPLVRPETTDYSGNARTLSGGTGTTTEDGPPIPWRVTSPRLILPASAAGGTVTGTATGAFGFTATATGVRETTGTATAAFGFTATSTGVDRALGSATAAFGFTATASGNARTLGAATAAFGFTATAAGVREVQGSATAAFGFTATAQGIAGTPPVTGAATAAFGFTATAQGQPRTLGAASASFGFTATASGRRTVAGLAVASFGFAAAALGTRKVSGSGQAEFGFTAAAVGIGTGPVTFGTATAATGTAPTASAATGTVPTAIGG